MKEEEIILKLNNFNELFIPRETNPLEQEDLFESGIKKIYMTLNNDWKAVKYHIKIFVPEDEIDSYTVKEVKDAINRYCEYKIKEVKKENRFHKLEFIKTSAQGISVLVLALFLSFFIEKKDIFTPLFNRIIREGLFIGAWVSLWHPFELILYNRWDDKWEYLIYEEIKKMKISIDIN